jgi:hypothetical protein
MLILFDHGTPRGIARALEGHTVKEARAQGWDTLSNGDLLKAAEDAGFDALLTTDKNLPHQQNLQGRKLAIVVLSNSRWSLVRTVLFDIAAAVNTAQPGERFPTLTFSTDFHTPLESHASRKPFPSANLNSTVSIRDANSNNNIVILDFQYCL